MGARVVLCQHLTAVSHRDTQPSTPSARLLIQGGDHAPSLAEGLVSPLMQAQFSLYVYNYVYLSLCILYIKSQRPTT